MVLEQKVVTVDLASNADVTQARFYLVGNGTLSKAVSER